MSAGAAPTTPLKPEEHVEALDPKVKAEAQQASGKADDSLLTYVYGQIGSLLAGGTAFATQQVEVLKKTASDVSLQLQTAAQQAVASVDQEKLKAAGATALGVRDTVHKSASTAATNVSEATKTLATNVQTSATRAAEITKPHVEKALAGARTTIETAKNTVAPHVTAVASSAATLTAGATAVTQETVAKAKALAAQTQEQAKGIAADATKKGADLTVIARDSSITALDRLESWLKAQHDAGKNPNSTAVQRMVAALASTEAAKQIQTKWTDIKAANQNKTPAGEELDIHAVQQQVAAQAASNAVAVVGTAASTGAPAAAESKTA